MLRATQGRGAFTSRRGRAANLPVPLPSHPPATAVPPHDGSSQVADATADAACNAYDRIADQEALQREQSLDGTNAGSVGGGGDGESAAAANRLGASLVRGVSAAASGASALGAGRNSLGASTRAAAQQVQLQEDAAAAAAAAAATSAASAASASPSGDGAAAAAATPRVPVSEAVLYQRTYFTPVMVSYVFGLALAFVANDITKLGQPVSRGGIAGAFSHMRAWCAVRYCVSLGRRLYMQCDGVITGMEACCAAARMTRPHITFTERLAPLPLGLPSVRRPYLTCRTPSRTSLVRLLPGSAVHRALHSGCRAADGADTRRGGPAVELHGRAQLRAAQPGRSKWRGRQEEGEGGGGQQLRRGFCVWRTGFAGGAGVLGRKCAFAWGVFDVLEKTQHVFIVTADTCAGSGAA